MTKTRGRAWEDHNYLHREGVIRGGRTGGGGGGVEQENIMHPLDL